jgi:putative endonuclease
MPSIFQRLFGSKKTLAQQHGEQGEKAARRYLKKQGLTYLISNFRSDKCEIDLIFRDKRCMIFVEVKTRSSEEWTRPAAAVDADKRHNLSRCALDYMKLLRNPRVPMRFDIVEVLLKDGKVDQIRHIPNAFPLTAPLRYADFT